MENITDIHMHVIPCVDDGSRSMEESVSMIREAARQGVSAIFATPHSFTFDYRPERVKDAFERLRQTAKDLELPVSLYFGCEMLVWPETADACVAKLRSGRYPVMNGTRYVLTEFDPYGYTQEDAEICVGKILSAGYVPIIAHVERYHFTTAAGIKILKDMGALTQINAYSVDSEKKAWIRENANALLKEHLVDFMGTDAHRMDHRPPDIWKGTEAMERLYTAEYARELAVVNPRRLLIGEGEGEV